MNKQELIKSYEAACFAITSVSTVLEDLKQLDEPQPIKLKDIISRMKQLFPLSRNEWINEILHEFGDEFGLWKYNAGYEQGKLEGEWVGQQLKDADKIRQEINKPTIPQFVADWYEENKDEFETKLFNTVDLVLRDLEDDELSEFDEWLIHEHTTPFQTLVNMHQFGYTVEKEKRYRVKMKKASQLLCSTLPNEDYYFTGQDTYNCVEHTRKQLEESGFGWVFDCEGIEIEEAE